MKKHLIVGALFILCSSFIPPDETEVLFTEMTFGIYPIIDETRFYEGNELLMCPGANEYRHDGVNDVINYFFYGKGYVALIGTGQLREKTPKEIIHEQ